MARHGRRSLSDSMIWAWAGGEGGSRLDDGGGRRGVVTSARAVRWRGRHDYTQCEAPRVTTNLGTDEALILDFVPEGGQRRRRRGQRGGGGGGTLDLACLTMGAAQKALRVMWCLRPIMIDFEDEAGRAIATRDDDDEGGRGARERGGACPDWLDKTRSLQSRPRIGGGPLKGSGPLLLASCLSLRR